MYSTHVGARDKPEICSHQPAFSARNNACLSSRSVYAWFTGVPLKLQKENTHSTVTIENRNFFDHKDLGDHLLHLYPYIMNHPVSHPTKRTNYEAPTFHILQDYSGYWLDANVSIPWTRCWYSLFTSISNTLGPPCLLRTYATDTECETSNIALLMTNIKTVWCVLTFNDAVSVGVCKVCSDTLINARWSAKDLKGKCCDHAVAICRHLPGGTV